MVVGSAAGRAALRVARRSAMLFCQGWGLSVELATAQVVAWSVDGLLMARKGRSRGCVSGRERGGGCGKKEETSERWPGQSWPIDLLTLRPALGALLLLVCVHMFAALSTTPASLSADADAVESVRILLVGNPGPCASP